jgi:K+-sensing histidine kinase KdpD
VVLPAESSGREPDWVWITERLLAAQHGRVWAENCPDGGARFTMAVPIEVHELEA